MTARGASAVPASLRLGSIVDLLGPGGPLDPVVQVVVVPLVAIFFHLEMDHLPELVLLLFLGTFGFVCAGTLFGALSVRSRARDLALSVVIFPLITPALLGGVVATRELFNGAPWGEIAGWIQILVAFDLVFLGAGFLLFDALLAD